MYRYVVRVTHMVSSTHYVVNIPAWGYKYTPKSVLGVKDKLFNVHEVRVTHTNVCMK